MASQSGPGGPWPTGARWRVLGVNPGCGFPAGGGGTDPNEPIHHRDKPACDIRAPELQDGKRHPHKFLIAFGTVSHGG